MHRREYRVALLPIFDLVADRKCSAYDCEFVALAQDLDVPLVTTNRHVLEQFSRVAVLHEAFIRA